MTLPDCDRTRVAPVFNWLLGQDPSGRSWFRKLVTMVSPEPGMSRPVPGDPGRVREGIWWPRAVSLETPYRLQAQQLRQVRAAARAAERATRAGGSAPVPALDEPPAPSALIVTARMMAVFQGRRDLPSSPPSPDEAAFCLARHLDALFEIRRGRAGVGLLICEGDAADPTAERRLHDEVTTRLASPDLLARWLPHRAPSERQAIAGGFMGVTTWQHVCREFGIPWAALPDAVPEVLPHDADWYGATRAWDPRHEHGVAVGRDLDPMLEAHRVRLSKRARVRFPPVTLTDAARQALQTFYRSPAWRRLRDESALGRFPVPRTRDASHRWQFVLAHDAKVMAALDWHADLLDGTWNDAADDALCRYYGRQRGGAGGLRVL